MLLQPPAEPSVRTENEHIDETGYNGETENGRSMRVMRNCFPRKSNLAIAQAAEIPKMRLSGTAIAAAIKVSLMADSASGSVNAEM